MIRQRLDRAHNAPCLPSGIFFRNFVHDIPSSCSHAITLAAEDMVVLAIGAGAEAPEADPVQLDAVPV